MHGLNCMGFKNKTIWYSFFYSCSSFLAVYFNPQQKVISVAVAHIIFLRVGINPDMISGVMADAVGKFDWGCGCHIPRNQILGGVVIISL